MDSVFSSDVISRGLVLPIETFWNTCSDTILFTSLKVFYARFDIHCFVGL